MHTTSTAGVERCCVPDGRKMGRRETNAGREGREPLHVGKGIYWRWRPTGFCCSTPTGPKHGRRLERRPLSAAATTSSERAGTTSAATYCTEYRASKIGEIIMIGRAGAGCARSKQRPPCNFASNLECSFAGADDANIILSIHASFPVLKREMSTAFFRLFFDHYSCSTERDTQLITYCNHHHIS